jgi:hypothetical protein
MKILLLFITITFLYSCDTTKQAAKKEKKYVSWLLANDKMADNCAELFPNIEGYDVRDSTHFDTLYLENLPDTIWTPDTMFVYHPPKTKYIKETKYITETRTVTNTAPLRDLEAKYKKLLADHIALMKAKDEQITSLQSQVDDKSKWKLYFFILAGLVLVEHILVVAFKIKKKAVI